MQPQGKEWWIHQEMKETRNKLPKKGMLFEWHFDVGSVLWISYFWHPELQGNTFLLL